MVTNSENSIAPLPEKSSTQEINKLVRTVIYIRSSIFSFMCSVL